MGVEWDTSTARRLAVVVPLSLAFTVFGLETIPPADHPTEMWATPGITLIWTAMVWDGRSRLGARQGIHVLAQLVMFVAVALAFGWPLGETLWMGVTNTAAGLGMLLAYARVRRGAGWAPRTVGANLALLGLAAVAGSLLALVGGLPNLEPGEINRLTLWWVVRNVVFGYVGPVTFLGLFFGGPRWRAERVPRWVVALLFPLGAACLWVTYLDPELPLTWFLLVPAVVAGTLLTLRGAALYSVYVAFMAALATLNPLNQYGYAGFIPGSVIIDMLITASTFITLHLAIIRDERAHAAAELERERATAHDQAELLRTVFESMSDGLVVLENHSVVVHNAAARQIMGKRIPVGEPMDWVSYFGLKDADGSPLTPESLAPSPDGRFARQMLVDGDAGQRVLEVGSWPLKGTADQTVVLFSDVTTQRERLSELTSFAGVVAHDLRSPLASLHGWLELAEDSVRGPEPTEAVEFLARARLNSHRMRQVIEDWLSYTVHRDGILSRSHVPLDDLLSEVVSPYASADSGSSPEFQIAAAHVVEADRVLTRQLLANLIGNAVKYARTGQRPHICVRSTCDEEAGFVRVEVSDRGVGLPVGEEERIFEEFHRAAAHAGSFAGTGLGLSLCRRIVERHGGSIHACNNPDGGATFSFTLPAA